MMPLKEAIRTPINDLPWYHLIWLYPTVKVLDGLIFIINKLNNISRWLIQWLLKTT